MTKTQTLESRIMGLKSLNTNNHKNNYDIPSTSKDPHQQADGCCADDLAKLTGQPPAHAWTEQKSDVTLIGQAMQTPPPYRIPGII